MNLPLWQIVRGSTAAPIYFPPEIVKVGEQEFVFVDGGVTMFNNPAFQLFKMATLKPYAVRWQARFDKMLLVSVGTGISPSPDANLRRRGLLYTANTTPTALMYAAQVEQDVLCRMFGKTVAGCQIDREIGDLKGSPGPATEKLFTYARYNAELTREGLDQLGLPYIKPEHVRKLDSVGHIDEMKQVGQKVGEIEVKPEHFAKFPMSAPAKGTIL